jgi:hypothetical protein
MEIVTIHETKKRVVRGHPGPGSCPFLNLYVHIPIIISSSPADRRRRPREKKVAGERSRERVWGD